MQKASPKKKQRPAQKQYIQPGKESRMHPFPEYDDPNYKAAGKREVAPCYVFLASDDSSYMTGQILHPNGGEIING